MKKYNLSLLFLLIALVLQASNPEIQKRKVAAFTRIYSSSSIDVVVEQTGKYAIEVQAPLRYQNRIITVVNQGELHVYVKGSYSYSGNIVVKVQVKDLEKVTLTGSGDFETIGRIKSPQFSFRVSGSGDMEADLNAKKVKGSLSGSGDVQISGITESFEVTQSGSGDLMAEHLDLLYAKLRMNSSGDTKFSGNADTFELYQGGSGDFSGRDFSVDDAKIRKTSSGDTRVTVEKSMEISISGSGDLYYSGRPEFKDLSVTGSGDIVRIK